MMEKILGKDFIKQKQKGNWKERLKQDNEATGVDDRAQFLLNEYEKMKNQFNNQNRISFVNKNK